MTEQSYTIRPAVENDADAAARMWSQMARQHRRYDPESWNWAENSTEIFREHIRRLTTREEGVVLMAVDAEDVAVGYLVAEVKEAAPIWRCRRRATVYDLFVEPDHRGRGLGRLLMETAEAALRDLEAEEIDLHVSVHNPQAVRFYEAMGMRRVAVRMYKHL